VAQPVQCLTTYWTTRVPRFDPWQNQLTSSEAHSLLCNGYRGSCPWGKARPGRDADHSPHLVPRSRMSRSYISSPPWRLHGVAGHLYFLYTS
jgi:hypothetical protein